MRTAQLPALVTEHFLQVHAGAITAGRGLRRRHRRDERALLIEPRAGATDAGCSVQQRLAQLSERVHASASAPAEPARAHRIGHADMDLLSWYSPYHDVTLREALGEEPARTGWGVYLTATGIESLALQAFVPAGLSWPEALRAAVQALYAHQLFHYLTEAAITAVEVHETFAHEGVLAHFQRHRIAHPDAPCATEEALANWHALRLSEPAHHQALLAWMAHAPPGQREVGAHEDDGARSRALRALISHCTGSAAHELVQLSERCFDLEHVHAAISDVPVHLVISLRSPHEQSAWRC